MDAETRGALAAFRDELEDRLEVIRREVKRLAGADAEVLQDVFRQFHSLKGAANLLNLGPIEQLAHRLEDVLSLARDRGLPPGTPLADFLLAAVGRLEQLGENLSRIRAIDGSRDVATVDRFIRAHWGAEP